METIIWTFVTLFILGKVISENNNTALKLGFVFMVSSLLTVILITVNDILIAKAAIAAIKAVPGLLKAWDSLKESWEEIVYYYNLEKKAQA